MHAQPFACALDRLERVIGPEFEGDFPCAKINWFAVYLTCTEILRHLSESWVHEQRHPCPGAPKHDQRWLDDGWVEAAGMLCLEEEFGEEIGSDFTVEHGEYIKHCRDAIDKALKGELISYHQILKLTFFV